MKQYAEIQLIRMKDSGTHIYTKHRANIQKTKIPYTLRTEIPKNSSLVDWKRKS